MIAVLLTKKIISLFIQMFLGGLLVKMKVLKSRDSEVISKVVIYLVTPCMILSAFQVDATPDVQKGILLSLFTGTALLLMFIVLTTLLAKVLHLNAVEQTSIIYTNCGNLLVPIVTSVLGPEWLLYTFGFLSVQIFLIWTHAKALLCGEKRPDFKSLFTNINLITIAVSVVIFLSGWRFPYALKDMVDSVAALTGPLCMITIGMILADQKPAEIMGFKRIWLVTALRLVIFPLISLALLKFSGLASLVNGGETILLISLLGAITPTATIITQMSQLYGHDAGYASAINVVTTLLCTVTMPVMVFLYQM